MLSGNMGSFTSSSAAGTASGDTLITHDAASLGYPDAEVYIAAASGTAPSAGTYGSELDTTSWTKLTSASMDVTLTTGYKYTIAALVDGKVIATSTGTVTSKA